MLYKQTNSIPFLTQLRVKHMLMHLITLIALFTKLLGLVKLKYINNMI